MSTPQFYSLTVTQIAPLTNDAVSVTFAVPRALRDTFAFTQGQYLTLRARVNSEDTRRSYSLCNSVQHYQATGELQVGIKRVDEGAFSSWACSALKAHDSLQVMPPQGRFFTALNAANEKHYLGIAAGSGITPLLSLIATTLAAEPQSRFTLIYSNRHVASVMFSEALEALKNQYLGRLQLIYLFSRQAQEITLFHGRVDEAKLRELLQGLLATSKFDDAFICGPSEMIDAAERALMSQGMLRAQLHNERFFSGAAPVPRVRRIQTANAASLRQITIVLDGKQHQVPLHESQAVLDAALDAGLDLPYSCKGGVCCTCRAKVLEGSVKMAKNFTLEQWEMEKGFVLTCQAQCTSAALTVSFDER